MDLKTGNGTDSDIWATDLDFLAIGPRIIEFRNRRGWPQRFLADLAQIRPARLSKIERSKNLPRLDELVRLALTFEVGLQELVFGEAPRGQSHQLLRELEALGTPEEVAGLGRLLQLLLLGYRTAGAGKP